MKNLILLILFIISAQAKSSELLPSCSVGHSFPVNFEKKQCQFSTSKASIMKIVTRIIKTNYPGLKKLIAQKKLRIREFKNDEYFLKTFLKLGHIAKKERTYYLDINKKLYNCAPSPLALEAILAHEIQHIYDYTQKKVTGLISLGLKMALRKSRSKYERQTDMSVMKFGYSQGVKAYRNWIYEQLDEKGLKKKKCNYYTPEEIDRYLQGERDFSDYYQKYCKKLNRKS